MGWWVGGWVGEWGVGKGVSLAFKTKSVLWHQDGGKRVAGARLVPALHLRPVDAGVLHEVRLAVRGLFFFKVS